MRCLRCGGLMISDRFQDLQDSTGHIHFYGTRCLVCGEVLDSTILENRRKHHLASTH